MIGMARWVVCLAAMVAMAVDSKTLFERAVKELYAGNYSAAEKDFQQVLSVSPRHMGALQNLGLVYSRTNRLDKAIEEYRFALTVQPSDPGVLQNLALAYLKKEDYSNAVPVLQQLIDVNPNATVVRDPELLYTEMRGYLKQNPTADGGTVAGDFLNRVPPASAAFVLCKIYFESGRFEEAADQCRKTLADDRSFPGAHRELGKALVSLHSSDAVTELRTAVVQDPNDSVAAYYLGVALLQDGKPEEAAPHLEESLRMDPNFWGSYYYLGNVKLQSGQPEAAIPLLRKAVELNADAAVAFYELGRALMAAGQTEEAERAMQRVKQLRAIDLEHDVQALRKK